MGRKREKEKEGEEEKSDHWNHFFLFISLISFPPHNARERLTYAHHESQQAPKTKKPNKGSFSHHDFFHDDDQTLTLSRRSYDVHSPFSPLFNSRFQEHPAKIQILLWGEQDGKEMMLTKKELIFSGNTAGWKEGYVVVSFPHFLGPEDQDVEHVGIKLALELGYRQDLVRVVNVVKDRGVFLRV